MKTKHLIVSAAVFFMAIGVQNASAENSLKKGEFGLGVQATDTPVFSAKYLIKDNLALLAGVGFNVNTKDASNAQYIVGAGVHKYIKVGDFAPFFGGRLAYVNNGAKTFVLQAEAGAEVFLQKHLSVEGFAAIGVSIASGGGNAAQISTTTPGVAFNYYW